MLSKFKLLDAFSRSCYRKFVNVPLQHYCSYNDFCTMIESTHNGDSSSMAESPELPSWVKFSEKEKHNPPLAESDDDFVIPAVADWIENQKLYDCSKVVRTTPREVSDSDVEKISEILKLRYSSPDEAAKAISDCSGVNVSDSLIEQLLKRFSHDWIPAFGVFNWAKVQTGYKPSADSYNMMVDILGKAKKFHLMWELMEEMHRFDGFVTLVTMSKIMRRLSKAGKWNDAIEAFRGMEQFGVNKDASAMNALMDTLAKENSVEDAQNVFLEFKNEIPPNAHTFNVLIHGWCKARKLEDAQKALEEMEKYGFQPDVISYTSFIEAYCREKDFRKVDATLDEMKEKGCPPNVVTYTIVMHSLGKSNEIRQALEVYEKMKRNGCVPDTAFYSSLIFVLGKSGRLMDAQAVFEDMEKQGVPRDVLTYNTMISIACHNSREETALTLFQKMEEASCKPDLKTYAPLLKMCCRKKRMKVLSFLLNHMFRNDISIEVGTYSLLVHGLCKNGKLEHACLFFEEMVSKGLTPKDSTYKLLMEKLEGESLGEVKEHIEKLMAQVKCEQTSSHFSKD